MSNSIYTKLSIPSQNNQITSQMYRGFSTTSQDTENYKLFDLALVKQDLLNHFYTRQGERLMNPRFGTVIWDLLYEPLTEDLKNAITTNVSEILNYDPRVVANQIVVTSYESGIQIECTLTYLPYNIQQSMQLRFDQTNGLLA